MSLTRNPKRLIILVGGVLLLGFLGSTYVSFHDAATRHENATLAQYQENQNVYDAYWKELSEISRVPEKYKEDFKDVLVGNTSARYGPDGSQAQWQWLREHSVDFDQSMYKRVMTVIEAGRGKFEANQKLLLDNQRAYRDHLKSFSGKIWAGLGGYPQPVLGENAPKKDLDGDGKLTVLDFTIVTSTRTREAFGSGVDDDPLPMFESGRKETAKKAAAVDASKAADAKK